MLDIVKVIFYFILIFIYFTNVKLAGSTLPLFYFISPVGLFFLFSDLLVGRVYGKILNFIFLLCILVFVSLVSMLINQYSDFYYLREVLVYTVISFIYVRLLVGVYLRWFPEKDIFYLFLFIVVSVFIQLLISFGAHLSFWFNSFVFNFFSHNVGFDNVDDFAKTRLIALGTPFFASAVLNAFVLVLVGEYLIKNKNSGFVVFIAMTIMLLGLFSARTTIFGILVFIIIVLSNYNSKSTFKYFLSMGGAAVAAAFILPFFLNDIEELMSFGFEFLTDFSSSQASNSVSDLTRMYTVLPNNFKTWAVGDSLYKDVNTGFYYKGIDVGYLRIIFSNGVLGLFVFLYIHAYLIFSIRTNYLSFISKISLVSLVLILNSKGVANMLPYLLLIFTFSVYKKCDYKVKGDL